MLEKTEQRQLETCLNWAEKELVAFDEARLDAEVLLAEVLGKNRTWLRVWPEYLLTEAQFQKYYQMLERRQKGEPVAYILGYKEFWSLNFKVSPDTLIPRPDTEVLVEKALELLVDVKNPQVVDLGTGTGAIAIAIASERADSHCYALDYSSQALEIARFNQESLQVPNVQCLQGSWLMDWSHGELDMIVSNPPYVAAGDPHLDSLTFEPYQALVANDEGFADYQVIISQATAYLKDNGWLVLEHGFEQAERLSQMLVTHGFTQIETVKDYGANPRVTFGRFNKPDN